MTLDPTPDLSPGRRLYEQARRLQQTKRRWLLLRVTVAKPDTVAKVLPFPTKEN